MNLAEWECDMVAATAGGIVYSSDKTVQLLYSEDIIQWFIQDILTPGNGPNLEKSQQQIKGVRNKHDNYTRKSRNPVQSKQKDDL